MPQDAFNRLRDEFHAILFGAVGDPRVPSNIHAKDILLGLRTRLDLYINLRPCRLYDERLSPLKGKGMKELQFTVFESVVTGRLCGALESYCAKLRARGCLPLSPY